MKVIYKRCRICFNWYRPQLVGHCQYCGAHEVSVKGERRWYVNKQGIEVVRGEGIPFEQLISAK
jgi:hypothetical protein